MQATARRVQATNGSNFWATGFLASFSRNTSFRLTRRMTRGVCRCAGFHAAARQSTLADIARDLNVASHVRSQSGMDVAANESILADVVESLMAAIYMDGGLEPVRRLIMGALAAGFRGACEGGEGRKIAASGICHAAWPCPAALPACRPYRSGPRAGNDLCCCG